ncbi:hypothetical protein DEJ33_15745 [Curtobacterium sp. MCPF17_047]|uniref:hypothetical protein n=1 Tax=Curtobacterium sp. MCPF17_047 TaxID=2175654 RepID=UPI000DA8F7C0|nr:hypothetical protein [Curtobacterium sp. MCPF17_047]PZF61885.1 hypothetical protein DEJ33_15745 [Curtobacterium sp. MCPF17_047]
MTDTTSTTMTTAATEALDGARAKLARLEAARERQEREALEGKLDATSLADFRDRLELARAVAAAAERAVAQEQSKLADPDTIRATLQEFQTDDAVGIKQLSAALKALSTAAATVEVVAGRRNAAVQQWRERLMQLGIPARGFSFDGNAVTISGRGDDAKVTVAGRGVTATSHINRLIAGSIPAAAQKAQPLDTNTIGNDDTRTTTSSHAEVRLLTDTGGKKAGTILSTRSGYTVSVLRRLVAYGSAELVSGELGEMTLFDQDAEASREAQAERWADATECPVSQ